MCRYTLEKVQLKSACHPCLAPFSYKAAQVKYGLLSDDILFDRTLKTRMPSLFETDFKVTRHLYIYKETKNTMQETLYSLGPALNEINDAVGSYNE